MTTEEKLKDAMCLFSQYLGDHDKNKLFLAKTEIIDVLSLEPTNEKALRLKDDIFADCNFYRP